MDPEGVQVNYMQFGLSVGKGTTYVTLTVTKTQQKYINKRRCYFVWVDLQKGIQYRIPGVVVNMFKICYCS